MNKQIEALKMAIAEIEGWIDHAYGHSPEDCADNKAIQACKKALAEAEKREWQSLSNDDMEKAKFYDESFYNGARWAEQVLKEKNYG